MKKKIDQQKLSLQYNYFICKKKKALRKKEWKNILSYSFQLSHLMVAMAVVTLETDFWDGEFAIKIEG